MVTSLQAGSLSQPLPNEPQDWITEWTGPRGADVIRNAITKAETPLTWNGVDIIIQYLKKSDVFGLEKVEAAAGGKEELTKLVGKYNPEKPLPLEVDDWMQAPLSQHFSEEALKAFPKIRKVTELYSLYWCPAGMTANKAEQIVKKYGTKFFFFYDSARKEHGNSPTSADCWIGFPNDVFFRDKTSQEHEALTPVGFEFPHIQEAVFCIFMRYACTGIRIMPRILLYSWSTCGIATYTRCKEHIQGFERHKVQVGGFDADGLSICRGDGISDFMEKGVAFVFRRRLPEPHPRNALKNDER